MFIGNMSLPTGDAVRAAGVTNAAFQSWVRRGLIPKGIDGGGSQGRHRRVSFCTVMQLALASKLMDVGLDGAPALEAATYFAHIGGEDRDFPFRLPGFPFPDITTPTIFAAGRHSAVAVPQGWKGKDTDALIAGRLLRLDDQSPGWIRVNASDIFHRVCGAFGQHPAEQLDLAYAKQGATP